MFRLLLALFCGSVVAQSGAAPPIRPPDAAWQAKIAGLAPGKLEELTLNLVEPEHPLLKAFEGKPFTHIDEPYHFDKAYADKNFRPLLEIDMESLEPKARKVLKGDRRFVSWIKPHGKGRVFYCSPSHRPETYERESMLQYYLDGIQYALGDLERDDSPVGK